MKTKKILNAVVKSFDPETHRAKILISTGDIDRDQEVIDPKAFKKYLPVYMKHPVLLSSHRTDTLLRQIGKAHEIIIKDEGVEGDYEWFAGQTGPDGKSMNPEADWGWFLVTRGVAAFSVGFMAKAWLDKWSNPMISAEDSAKGIQRRFTEIELFENSQVLIPANPNAVQRRLSEAEGEEKELLELATKSLKAEELEPFIKAEQAKEQEEHEKKIANFKAMLKDAAVSAEIKEMIQASIKEMIESDSLPNLKKHYSELLLGGGDNDPKHAPTKDAEGEEQKQKPINHDALLKAVKEGVQEGITG